MFDFSFGEIFVIAVVAVIFLGPDKLPQAFVKIAKFLRAVKKTINDAKDTLDREIHITEMKQDALEYKKKFADSAEKLKNDILQDADVEGIKHEIEGAKSAAILNESLEKSSISFDEVENRGKAMQKRLKNNLKQKNAESSLDSANQTQNAESNFSCHSERSEESKNNPSLRADSQNLRGNPQGFARAVARSNQPPIKKTQNLKDKLPRSINRARNDDSFLDSANKKPKKSPKKSPKRAKNESAKANGS